MLEIANSAAMEEFGRGLAGELSAGDLIILAGALGAGKTTLTRGIGEGLGVRGPVQSPTFVLARSHPSLIGGVPLVHVDAYRLASAEELWDLDVDFEHSVVVVEWGLGLLDSFENRLEIFIKRNIGSTGKLADLDTACGLDSAETRTITITGHGSRWRDVKIQSLIWQYSQQPGISFMSG